MQPGICYFYVVKKHNKMSVNLHGLRTVVYMVTDVAKAKEWYSNAFGIQPYFDEPFYVGFNIGGYELGLHPADADTIPSGLGGTAYWGVDNAQDAFDSLIAAGATSLEEPSDVGGGIVAAAVRDPWGNPLGIIYNPHFKLP
jgi:lactoylglutathione lyase